MRSIIFIFLLIYTSTTYADNIPLQPHDLELVLKIIAQRNNGLMLKDEASVDINDVAVTFSSGAKDHFNVKTQFYLHTSTIDKRISISRGDKDLKDLDMSARIRLTLDNEGRSFKQFLYKGWVVPVYVYDREEDMFIYVQTKDGKGGVVTKEWIYARKPNCPQGSIYSWKVLSEQFNRRFVFEADENGAVRLKRQVVVAGIDPNDYDKQRHAVDLIHKVSKGEWYISGEDVIADVPSVIYQTKEGVRKKAAFNIQNHNSMVEVIHESAANYPLLIESQ